MLAIRLIHTAVALGAAPVALGVLLFAINVFVGVRAPRPRMAASTLAR
jgi:hypothetical protein